MAAAMPSWNVWADERPGIERRIELIAHMLAGWAPDVFDEALRRAVLECRRFPQVSDMQRLCLEVQRERAEPAAHPDLPALEAPLTLEAPERPSPEVLDEIEARLRDQDIAPGLRRIGERILEAAGRVAPSVSATHSPGDEA